MIKAIKTFFLILLFSTVFVSKAYSEESCSDRLNKLTYYGGGIHTLNISDLNTVLTKSSYKSFPTSLYSIGGGSRSISGKLVTGSDWNVSLENKNLNTVNGFNSYISSSANILLNAGYIIFSAGDFNVYPILGGGIGRITMDIVKDGKAPDFNDSLSKPEKMTSFSSLSLLLDLGIGADYLVKLGKSEPKKGGIVFGLKVGSMFTVYQTNFQLKGESVPGSPAINNNGFYIKLFAGYTDGIFAALFDMF